jgi:6,7-dimethyl-8-ribityllumazine synthase
MALDSNSGQSTRALPPGARVAAVVSSYHRELSAAMLDSARRELAAAGLLERDFLVVDAPGAFELPLIARRLARRPDVHAVLCFGLVLKGETSHDRYVADAAARGILEASLETDKPVLFGVLTCDTLEQARSRALPPDRGGVQDKGREVARACIDALLSLRAADSIGREADVTGRKADVTGREADVTGREAAP